MEIIWSRRALTRLNDIAATIAQDDFLAAETWVNSVFNKVKRLENFPRSGRRIAELNRQNIREIIFGNYRIIYRFEKKQISILTVWHGMRILPIEKLE